MKASRAMLAGGLAVALAIITAPAAHPAGTTATCPPSAVTPAEGTAMNVIRGEIRLPTPTAALTLSTTQVRHGRTELDLTVLDTTTPRPGTFLTNRKELSETAQSITGGLEQSWCFTQPPRGTGNLVVRVTSYATTAHGTIVPATEAPSTDGILLHYPNLATATYHHGTWIDSRGQRSPVTARFVDNAIELTVPSDVLATSTFPATLDPKIVVTPL